MNAQERFDYAKTYRMPFGAYKTWELNQIAADEDEGGKPTGLLYLGWLRSLPDLQGTLKTALDNFTGHPQVDIDIEAAMERYAIQNEGRSPRLDKKGKY